MSGEVTLIVTSPLAVKPLLSFVSQGGRLKGPESLHKIATTGPAQVAIDDQGGAGPEEEA